MARMTAAQRSFRRDARAWGKSAASHARMAINADREAEQWRGIVAALGRLEQDSTAIEHAQGRASYFQQIADKETQGAFTSARIAAKYALRSMSEATNV